MKTNTHHQHKQLNPPPARNYSVFFKSRTKLIFLGAIHAGGGNQVSAFLNLRIFNESTGNDSIHVEATKVAILLVPSRYILFGAVFRIYHVFWTRFGFGFGVRLIDRSQSIRHEFLEGSFADDVPNCCKNNISVIGSWTPDTYMFQDSFPGLSFGLPN